MALDLTVVVYEMISLSLLSSYVILNFSLGLFCVAFSFLVSSCYSGCAHGGMGEKTTLRQMKSDMELDNTCLHVFMRLRTWNGVGRTMRFLVSCGFQPFCTSEKSKAEEEVVLLMFLLGGFWR